MTVVKEIKITREQNKMVRQILDSHMAALKNWIISAVEAEDMGRANIMIRELRDHQEMCHTFVPDDMFPTK